MSTTAAVAAAPHTLIRREGPRTGSFHAALPEGAGWRTACGEQLEDGPRGVVHAYELAEAVALLAPEDGTAPVAVCRRCERVGDSLSA